MNEIPVGLLTIFIDHFLTGVPDASVELLLHELVVPCLPDVLHSLAAVALGAVEADAEIPLGVSFAEGFGHFPGPFTPVAAAESCDGEN